MRRATFRFYEELNDFLPEHRGKTDFVVELEGRKSVKDMIEALGVPHTEIDMILVNGKSVDFGYILQDGDRVSVYPVFESFNIENVTRLREGPLRKTRFIAAGYLGDVVKYMRMLGFDVYYDPSLSDEEIIEKSKSENRIILTKRRKILKFKGVAHGIFIHQGRIEEQIGGIVDTLDIKDRINPFSRCLACNSPLERVSKEDFMDRIPRKTRDYCNRYARCRSCDKIYWNGIHFVRMQKVVKRILVCRPTSSRLWERCKSQDARRKEKRNNSL